MVATGVLKHFCYYDELAGLAGPSGALQLAEKFIFLEGYGLYRLRKNSVLYQGTTLVVP
jgi:hypothetical protein